MTLFIGGIGFQEIIVITLFLAFIFIIPLIALIDALRSDFRGQNDKIMWVIIIIFFPFIGSVLYFFIGRRQKAF
jgi:hypothetical protein